MKKSLFFAALSGLLLASCTQAQGTAMSNPLYAKQYYADMADFMVGLSLHNDPSLKDEKVKEEVDRTRSQAARMVQELTEKMADGRSGRFTGENTAGAVLLLNETLYTGSDFFAQPTTELHLYVTDAVDPRDVRFPDASAVDLGVVPQNYGAFSVPVSDVKAITTRSVVLFDPKLKMLVGFAQVSANR